MNKETDALIIDKVLKFVKCMDGLTF